MIYKFTNRAKKSIEIANDISLELGHNYIGTEHILYGLIKEGEGIASKVLTNKGITEETINTTIITRTGINSERSRKTILILRSMAVKRKITSHSHSLRKMIMRSRQLHFQRRLL